MLTATSRACGASMRRNITLMVQARPFRPALVPGSLVCACRQFASHPSASQATSKAHLAVTAAALLVGAVLGLAAPSMLQRLQTRSPPAAAVSSTRVGPVTDSVASELTSPGLPTSSLTRQSATFAAHVGGGSTRTPLWVMEHLSAASLQSPEGSVKQRERLHFSEEPDLAPHVRATLAAYSASHAGVHYDRGHMAAAANHRGSSNDMSDTFYLSNVCPQVGIGLNRDYWARLEAWTRSLTRTHAHVWVVTGPLYVPRRTSTDEYSYTHGALGPPLAWVAVPTHFYKVVLTRQYDHEQPVRVAAFIVPNEKVDAATPLQTFSVPLEVVEACAGILFFRDALQDSAVQSTGEEDAVRVQNAVRVLDVPAAAVTRVHSRAAREVTATETPSSKQAPYALHLCDADDNATTTTCELPPPNWFAAGVQQHDGKQGSEKHMSAA